MFLSLLEYLVTLDIYALNSHNMLFEHTHKIIKDVKLKCVCELFDYDFIYESKKKS